MRAVGANARGAVPLQQLAALDKCAARLHQVVYNDHVLALRAWYRADGGGFRVKDLGFRVQDLGVKGSEVRV